MNIYGSVYILSADTFMLVLIISVSSPARFQWSCSLTDDCLKQNIPYSLSIN